ncbi:hypothetical protein CCACVL1_02102 [Corchorus capsularis]|uniref:Uncharacterized protein n=1 Tax=Corchorus capsularis TaxID=210143 RepID=A0A1R3KCU3_COCAP|nr:hypothetical protein CCACVL1_02102 [Corchorus capsularis]
MMGSWRREKEGFGEEAREEGTKEMMEERDWMDDRAMEEEEAEDDVDDGGGGASEVGAKVGDGCKSGSDVDGGVTEVLTAVTLVALGESGSEEEEEEPDIG